MEEAAAPTAAATAHEAASASGTFDATRHPSPSTATSASTSSSSQLACVSTAEAMNPHRRCTMEDVTVFFPAGSSWNTNSGAGAGSTSTSSSSSSSSTSWNYCAVYDGHGGRDMVDFLKFALHHHVATEIDHLAETRQQSGVDDNNNNHNDDGGRANLALALERAFLITDIHAKHVGISSSGATVALCLIKKLHDRVEIVAANAGDARIVLCTNSSPTTHLSGTHGSSPTATTGGHPVAVRLTTDHNCTNASECERIEKSGGFVFRNRVVGVLAITRSLGDQVLKPYVLAHPFICHAAAKLPSMDQGRADGGGDSNTAHDKENHRSQPAHPLGASDKQEGPKLPANESAAQPTSGGGIITRGDFVIVACDGLWDVMDDQTAVNVVLAHLQNGVAPRDVAKCLVDESLRRGTTDNVSAMVVFL